MFQVLLKKECSGVEFVVPLPGFVRCYREAFWGRVGRFWGRLGGPDAIAKAFGTCMWPSSDELRRLGPRGNGGLADAQAGRVLKPTWNAAIFVSLWRVLGGLLGSSLAARDGCREWHEERRASVDAAACDRVVAD